MTTQQVTTTTDTRREYKTVESVETINGCTVVLQVNGTGYHRLTLVQQGREYDVATDFSALDWNSRMPTLDAIMKYGSGLANGDPKFFTSAPPDKIDRDAPTGVFGYVRHDYQPGSGVELETAEGTRLLDVEAIHLPKVQGFGRLYYSPTGLYARPQDCVLTPAGEYDPRTGEIRTYEYIKIENGNNVRMQVRSTKTYWYVAAMSEILAGANISVGLPTQELLNEAHRVLNVLKADNVAEAHSTVRNARRVLRREQGDIQQETIALTEDAPQMSAPTDGILVPLTEGGFENLLNYKKGDVIPTDDELGFELADQKVWVGSVQELTAIRNKFLQMGWTVRKSLS